MVLSKNTSYPAAMRSNFRSSHRWTRKLRTPNMAVRFGVGLGLTCFSVGSAALAWNYHRPKISPFIAQCEHQTISKDISSPKVAVKNKFAPSNKSTLEEAVTKSRELILRNKDEVGAPGIVVGVSVDSEVVWEEGFGYSDLENRVKCFSGTVMRIASISKSLTMAVVGKLWENNQLDLDKPVQTYVPDFPKKMINGEEVEITCRHLVSHLSGIRHYKLPESSATGEKKNVPEPRAENELESKEFLLYKNFKTVSDSLKLFQDDPLVNKPGEKYLYTTFGYTLLSAVVEKLVGEPFSNHMVKTFLQFGMLKTYLDINNVLIYNRSCYYNKNKIGKIENVPCVDNSYKWAGGGFLSTVGDLLKFGNIMLYSYQHSDNAPGLPGYLKQSTVQKMWSPVQKTVDWWKGDAGYGMGWVVAPKRKENFGECNPGRFFVTHSGGAVGASSVLLILPREGEIIPGTTNGVTVAIITNLEGVSLSVTAAKIAKLFEAVDFDL